ncbi:MAG TPA: hypothetical protein VFD67_05395 [Gemmatimonadaceae bacterium]|nr:hypothetical protein [Gemmatimonadaceae bacterium]
MHALKNRVGFALPLVVIFMVVLSFALAAGLAATAAEGSTSTAQRGQNKAYQIAELGLQKFLVKRDSLCSATSWSTCIADPSLVTSGQDSVNFAIPGGYVVVVAKMLRPQQGTKDTIPALFFVRARGVDSTTKLRGSDTTSSVRSIGMMIQWSTATMKVSGAWVSLSGLDKQGAAGQIDGNDQCGRKPAVAGVLVPKGDYTTSGGFVPTGNPPLDTSKTLAQLEPTITINWAAILDSAAIPVDFNIPQDPFPTADWFLADTSRWPVIRIHGDYSLPNAGRGIIIADGNFTISGSNMWNGIILIGGQLTSDGNNTTSGATVSGLNYKLPGAPQPPPGYINDNATANGTKSYVYNSCYVSRATKSLKHYVPMADTWIDDVPIW